MRIFECIEVRFGENSERTPHIVDYFAASFRIVTYF